MLCTTKIFTKHHIKLGRMLALQPHTRCYHSAKIKFYIVSVQLNYCECGPVCRCAYCAKPRVFLWNRRYCTLDPTYVRVSTANGTLVPFVPTSIAQDGFSELQLPSEMEVASQTPFLHSPLPSAGCRFHPPLFRIMISYVISGVKAFIECGVSVMDSTRRPVITLLLPDFTQWCKLDISTMFLS